MVLDYNGDLIFFKPLHFRGRMAKDPEKKKKEKRPTAEKREIQNKKRRLINKSFKSNVRTAIRKFDASLEEKDQTVITENLNNVYSLVDKAVKRGVFKLNKASRVKSRLAARAKRQVAA